MRFLPAALVAIVWCNTSNENLDLKSKTDTHISHSSSKVFKKAAFPRGFLKETHHWPTYHGSRQSKRLLMIQIETYFTAKPSKCEFFRGMVGARGFEPPTSRSQTERTTRLCYAPSFLRKFGNLPNERAILAAASCSGQGSDECSGCLQRKRAMADLVLGFDG